MKIQVNNTDLKVLFEQLQDSKQFICSKNGFEYCCGLDPRVGIGKIKGYRFDDGFNLIHFKVDLFSPLAITIHENKDNILRYIFSVNGNLLHTLTKAIRYRLTKNTASIVAIKGVEPQTFTFPVQNDANIFMLQVNAKSFSLELDKDFQKLPQELSDVLSNHQMSGHFFFHGNYPLDVAETLTELLNDKTEGLVKRFFIESKALELLWMQTDRFRNEYNHGYQKAVLNQADMELIRKARAFIRDHFNEKITLIDLAREVGTNATKIKVGFKKLYGRTFTELLRDDRLLKAKVLLESGEYNVKEVASEVGYNSLSMFGKRFKEKYGINPGSVLSERRKLD